ncbi:hypothetical protein [Streptomyces sp. NPDC052107]
MIDRSMDSFPSAGAGSGPLTRRGVLRGAAAPAAVPVLIAAGPPAGE